jgi:hypothetical protein
VQRDGLPPAPERKRTTTWSAFIRTHLALLAGTDFFTAEVLTLRGLMTYYVLFFIHLESRRVDIAGITIVRTENLNSGVVVMESAWDGERFERQSGASG